MPSALETINALGALATVVTLLVAIGDLRKARKWRRAEFVAGLIKDWEAQPGVQAVFQLLDYRGKELEPTDYGGKTAGPPPTGTGGPATEPDVPHPQRP